MICESGADVSITDLVGRNPVWTAVSQDGRLTQVARLLRAFCDANVPDKRDKRLPLQVEVTQDHMKFIHFGYFYSATSRQLLLRGAPNYSINTVSELTLPSAANNCE